MKDHRNLRLLTSRFRDLLSQSALDPEQKEKAVKTFKAFVLAVRRNDGRGASLALHGLLQSFLRRHV